jgi:glycerol uptake facilitator-like aquaporin
MDSFDIARRLTAEALGTALLVGAVIGSGIMAAKLSGGNDALALLCNTLATGAILVVIIILFAPVSGAHFNPVVSLVMAIRGELSARCGCLSSCRSLADVSAPSSPI